MRMRLPFIVRLHQEMYVSLAINGTVERTHKLFSSDSREVRRRIREQIAAVFEIHLP